MPSAVTLASSVGFLPMATSWRRDFNRFGTLPTKGSRTHNSDTRDFRKAVHAQLSTVDLRTKFELVTNLTTEVFILDHPQFGPGGEDRATGRDPTIGRRPR